MTKKEITEVVMEGATGEYSHCIIYCDHWDYNDSCRYVEYDENIHKVINNIKSGGSPGMYSIEEIYNYNLDLKKQLNEKRAYHIEPLDSPKKDKEKKDECLAKPDKPEIDRLDSSISKELEKALNYAIKMHKGQTRQNGEPYINHPLHVVQNVLKYKKSKNIEALLISACLHDTIEDTQATYYDIAKNFGPQVASLVLELTTDEDMKNLLGKQQYLSIKMKNMSSWALVIKLCDRLDNVNDLENCKDEAFKNKYIYETIGIIDYLLKNAKLTTTHLTIIEQILTLLLKLNKDHEKIITLIALSHMMAYCSTLKPNFQNDDNIFKNLIKIADYMDSNQNSISKKLIL